MNTLLLEIFVEEMPSSMIFGYCEKFTSILSEVLLNSNITFEFTPRRIAVFANNIQEVKQDEKIRGPKVDANINAINGFLKKYNITQSELIEESGYYSYTPPKKDIKLLIKELIEKALKETIWPKSMRWGESEIQFVRPIHSILCMLNNEIIDVKYGHIKASNTTVGHRFLSNNKITITDQDQYKELLLKNHVILSANERKKMILNQIILKVDSSLKLIQDESLLDEIVNLVEFPTVYVGEISEQFMKLPKEVIISTLRKNQKYLMLEDHEGNLANKFIIVSNNIPEDGGKEIITGNQKVTNARLSDALFFFQKDSQTPLESKLDSLKSIVFHKQIGDLFSKIMSVKEVGKQICETFYPTQSQKVQRAIELMKCDLTSYMVGEFPDLQGIMGYYYSASEDMEVRAAIKDQYKPSGPNDSLPSGLVGKIVALADKIDTLNKMFGCGIKPTGSKDPYALRRAANGVIRISKDLEIFEKLDQLPIIQSVHEFIAERNL